MSEPEIRNYYFGPYCIDTGERLLRRGDEIIALPPKAIQTLLALVVSEGRMVEKGELMRLVWPDTFVEEGALTRNISLLRKVLGASGDAAEYIETIPKRGYRFVATVETTARKSPSAVTSEAVFDEQARDEESLSAGVDERIKPEAAPKVIAEEGPAANVSPSTMGKSPIYLGLVLIAVGAFSLMPRKGGHQDAIAIAAVAPPLNALAILPFRNVDSDAEQEYFADGMTQALVTGLAKLGNLRVISLASHAEGKDSAAIANALRDPSVKRVLTGTVQRSGGRVRIDAQLIDPKTRAVYWANEYQRDLKDVLALQSAVAQAIAIEIQVMMTTEERGRLQEQRQVNPQALDAYMRGRYFWNRRTEQGMRRASQYFQQSIDSDPGYAPAYSGLSDSYSMLAAVGIDVMPPNTAMPMARAAALKAIELDPNLAEGHVSLAYVKFAFDWDLPGARQEFERAMVLDPAAATGHHWFSHYYMAAGDLGKAMDEMQAALRLEPLSPSINIGIGWCYYYGKQYDKAIELHRSVVEMDPSFPMAHQALGMAYQQKGMVQEAVGEFKTAVAVSGNSPSSVAGLASAYAAAGQIDLARRELDHLRSLSRVRFVPAFHFATVHWALGEIGGTFQWGWKALDERSDYLMYLRTEPRASGLAAHPEFMRVLAGLHP